MVDNVHIVLDSELLASASALAFHANASDKTAFVNSDELKTFLETNNFKFTEINFAELVTAAPAPKAVQKS